MKCPQGEMSPLMHAHTLVDDGMCVVEELSVYTSTRARLSDIEARTKFAGKKWFLLLLMGMNQKKTQMQKTTWRIVRVCVNVCSLEAHCYICTLFEMSEVIIFCSCCSDKWLDAFVCLCFCVCAGAYSSPPFSHDRWNRKWNWSLSPTLPVFSFRLRRAKWKSWTRILAVGFRWHVTMPHIEWKIWNSIIKSYRGGVCRFALCLVALHFRARGRTQSSACTQHGATIEN